MQGFKAIFSRNGDQKEPLKQRATSSYVKLQSFENPIYGSKEDHCEDADADSAQVTLSEDNFRIYTGSPCPYCTRGRVAIITGVATIFILLIVIIVAVVVARSGSASSPQHYANPTKTFRGIIRIVKGQYSTYFSEYNDVSSTKYKKLATSFTEKVDKIFKRSILKDVYQECIVIKLSQGSVVVEFKLYFKEYIMADTKHPAGNGKYTIHDVTTSFLSLSSDKDSTLVVEEYTFDITTNFKITPDYSGRHSKPSTVAVPTIKTHKSTTVTPYVSPSGPDVDFTTQSSQIITTSSIRATMDVIRVGNKTMCPPGYFLCPNGVFTLAHVRSVCIMEQERCDGYEDCVMGWDEKDCNESCSNGGFRCRGKQAIDEFLRGKCTWKDEQCDGFADCTDGSDEENCHCGKEEFRCINGTDIRNKDKCVPSQYLCDREPDCSDGSDEFNCNYTCPDGRFMCANGLIGRYPYVGYCIDVDEQCDGHSDCKDGSDEKYCEHVTCPGDSFKCEMGKHKCIPKRYYCDRDSDCEDRSDENNCTYGCPKGQRACDSGTIARFPYYGYCVFEHEWCNGFLDCTDKSDEQNCTDMKCSEREFRCIAGHDTAEGDFCIPTDYKCDKVQDCSDGSDEKNCNYACPPSRFACHNGTVSIPPYRGFCLHTHLQCDGLNQCTDGSDELQCKSCQQGFFSCRKVLSEQLECIHERFLCDRNVHCEGGEDEVNCTYTCPEGKFPCSTGIIARWPFHGFCIHDREKCDGFYDCQDHSDEQDCISTETPCEAHQFRCKNGSDIYAGNGCLDKNYRCNRYYDCMDKSDEEECNYRCERGKFACHNSTVTMSPQQGFCIEESKRCDGKPDCLDHSDEADCDVTCDGNTFRCETGVDKFSGRRCIGMNYRCDRVEDCTDGSDEHSCEYKCPHEDLFVCSNGTVSRWNRGICIPEHMRCDGHQDCSDNSDELVCVCSKHEFQCSSEGSKLSGSRCIPASYRCDREDDCADGSDERNCIYECKESNMVKCESGIIARYPHYGYCIYKIEVCDSYKDCLDGSDESNCTNPCAENEFRCLTGDVKCIPKVYVCDRKADCMDNTDEVNCPYTCPLGKSPCKNGTVNTHLRGMPQRGYCLYDYFICDGVRQCVDGSDEDDCDGVCPPGEFKCVNGSNALTRSECIPSKWKCDRDDDCSDGSDEEDCSYPCTSGKVPCKTGKISYWPFNGYCIYKSMLCNGKHDCFDGSDEANCTCNSNKFRCKNGTNVFDGGVCIEQAHRCDRVKDCSDNSDEINCRYECTHPQQELMCVTGPIARHPRRGYCYQRHQKCNGIADCKDSSDELDCSNYKCHAGLWKCENSTQCILSHQRCDDEYDCSDGSDELGCDVQCPEGTRSCESQSLVYGTGHCYNRADHCDGFVNCRDHSDEKNCNYTCKDSEFKCGSPTRNWGLVCIPPENICDNMAQCYNGADEMGCEFKCEKEDYIPCLDKENKFDGRTCVPINKRCDGQADCPYGSDEYKC